MTLSTADGPAFRLADAPFDIAPLRRRLLHDSAGAFSSFEGWVRDHNDGRPVHGLRYESYVALAEREGAQVIDEARARFALVDALCVHRIGDLAIGDLAVWVGVSAAHRGAAFDACRYIIDEVKARVPIWKHERYADGDTTWLHPEADTGPAPGRGAA
ncbi:molybdenum cofactor biosynthesis protein MoaE [Luteimonas sp. BDR2-5]|uniref:molybdenum cofactor biosynthesis protein MoaE n=1 Tax=Proluteimonas luteida TaxID=2878685 RepID=UPI001E4C72CD|nr:molybdenum cofactor biosynthesis protein MoaE [Luteimonas sp. BDR2-5]MCD9027648.1 molybdenum cofactor biosynthesis protein MoaE [Luteimonas sp. BDR2-5]